MSLPTTGDEAGRDVQEPLPQRLGFAHLQRLWQGGQSQPCGEVGGDRDEGEPGLVDSVLAGGGPARAGVFGDGDTVLDAGVGPMPRFEEPDRLSLAPRSPDCAPSATN